MLPVWVRMSPKLKRHCILCENLHANKPLNFNACTFNVKPFPRRTDGDEPYTAQAPVARDVVDIRRAGSMNSVLAHGGRPLLLSAAKRTQYAGLVRATAGLQGVGPWVNIAAAARSTTATPAGACSVGGDRYLLRQGGCVAVPRNGISEVAGRRLLHNAAATEPEEVCSKPYLAFIGSSV